MCNNTEEPLSCQCECQHPLVIAQVSLHVDNGMLIALGKDNGKGGLVAGMKMGGGWVGVGRGREFVTFVDDNTKLEGQ